MEKVMAHPFLLPPQRWKRTLRIVKILTGKLVAVLGSQLQPGVSRVFLLVVPLFGFFGWCLHDEMGVLVGMSVGQVIAFVVVWIRSSRTPGWSI